MTKKKIDIILEWVTSKRAPKKFKPAWTIEMQGIISVGNTLTKGQKESLDNVIFGWKILDGKQKKNSRSKNP